MLTEAAIRFLREQAPLAHVVTLDPDGSPHVTVAWVDVQNGEVVFATLFDQRKLANIRARPRVSLSFEATTTNEVGMRHYLVVDGEGRVEPSGAPELLSALAQRYVGPGTTFPPMPDPPPGYLVRIRPTGVRGVGPWAG